MAFAPTRAQHALLRFIVGYTEAKGFAPTRREMMEALGNRSKARPQEGILRLEKRGWLRTLPAKARAIEVLQPVAIPRAPDGAPLYFVRIGEAS